jgi:2-oxoglutarate ferredoxin oxidoreductase subunit alpha
MQPLKTTYPDWAVRGAEGREKRVLSSIYIKPEEEEVTNLRLLERWSQIQANEIRYKEYFLDDAEIAIIGFGTAGRVSLSAVRLARQMGIKAGLFRPVTASPFPEKQVRELSERVQSILVVEMNAGQMLDDVRRAAGDRAPVDFYGRLGGMVPYPEEILNEIQRVAKEPPAINTDPRYAWMQRLKLAIA